ncbi:uncharacterized protein LOC129289349 [Prosopis cineraria]|uniref:uncharacterized protein LOC129289349 n=1 Tax=Prosopis cineraria TaxID=364024 RepID=UPI00240FCAE1|nr:uncharacterized protein LOC129289349 [Prosopis cineraria]
MEEYLSKMKLLSDHMALAGHPLALSDLIMQTLADLDVKYTPMVVYLADKPDLSWIDLQSYLLTYEWHLEHLTNASTVSHAFANLSFRSDNSTSFSSTQVTGSSYTGSRPPWKGRGQGGRGRGRHSRGNKPSHSLSSAYYATSETGLDPAWYVDSGASNHMAHLNGNDPRNNDATGSDILTVGNGSGLRIAGHSSGFIGCGNNTKLSLNDVLVVPAIKKNLLNVSEQRTTRRCACL